MILSYKPLMGEAMETIEAEITTDHPASSYGMPAIVLEDGRALDYNSAIILDYRVEEATEEEAKQLEKWRRNMPPIDSMISSAATLGRKGGKSTSEAKQKASRENGKKGGRPKNNWFVANDNGDLAGHDLSKTHAQTLAAEMRDKEPDAGWEAMQDDE